MQCAGKVAVITGGASGIGRGTALAMARRGTDVVIADINDRALEQIPMEDWEWSFGINLLGVVRGIRTFLPHMLERGSGYIINTGSVAGLITLTGEGAPYVASKLAVVGLSEALALYARPQGIGVSVLCPGSVDTNLLETERAVGMTPERALAEAASTTVFHSVLMTPEQIGEIVVEAVQQQRFFVLPDQHQHSIIVQRAQDMNAFLEARLTGPL